MMNPIKKLIQEYKATRRNVQSQIQEVSIQIEAMKVKMRKLANDLSMAKATENDARIQQIRSELIDKKMELRNLKEMKKTLSSDVSNLNYAIEWMQTTRCPGRSLAKKAIAGSVNETTYDLTRPILTDAQITIYDAYSVKGLEVIRHSTAHLLAQAVKRLYPDAHFGVGPVIENGFYYDIEMAHPLVPEDLILIEKEMKKIVSENLTIHRKEVTREEAKHLFKHDPLKLELLAAIPSDELITVYEQGEFYDLCRGPHVPSTNKLQHFKLQNISGAYWRGNSNNQMLQRIDGIAFAHKEDMQNYFKFLEEAERRNHRKLGKELELFMFSEEAPGMPFYLANGQIIRNELESFLRNLQIVNDYREVRTPLMMNQRLWEQSGHWQHYKENMYFTQVDEQKFALKPMNCPGHMLIYLDSAGVCTPAESR